MLLVPLIAILRKDLNSWFIHQLIHHYKLLDPLVNQHYYGTWPTHSRANYLLKMVIFYMFFRLPEGKSKIQSLRHFTNATRTTSEQSMQNGPQLQLL